MGSRLELDPARIVRCKPAFCRRTLVLTELSIPANMRFLQMDIEEQWQDMDPGSWDLIHMRSLIGSIGNWPRVYAEAYR